MSLRVLLAGGGTGGHLYPAIALAEALRTERPDTETHFVGAERGVEARVLPARGLPHTLLPLLPFHRDGLWRNWRLIPASVRVASGLGRLFRTFRPALVVGTGGYASGPAGLMAVVQGVPLALQEQNSWPGVTTRLLARWARQIHLGFPEAERHLRPGRQTRVFAHGNPITPPDPARDRAASRRQFGLAEDVTTVLVVGGSQGARALNEALIAAIEETTMAGAAHGGGAVTGEGGVAPAMTGTGEAAAQQHASRAAGGAHQPVRPPFQILWATGPAHLMAIQERVEAAGAAGWVRVLGYIDDMQAALTSADVAVSRAGAMATAELLALGIPALLVPLPTAAADHQTHNARALEQAGAAICLEERALRPATLWSELIALAGDEPRRRAMADAALRRSRPDAARAIARDLLTLVAA